MAQSTQLSNGKLCVEKGRYVALRKSAARLCHRSPFLEEKTIPAGRVLAGAGRGQTAGIRKAWKTLQTNPRALDPIEALESHLSPEQEP